MKTFTLWTVVWTQEGRTLYSIPALEHAIVPLEDHNGIEFNVNKTKVGRPKIRKATVFPIFDEQEEAEAYRSGNPDWEVVPITLTF